MMVSAQGLEGACPEAPDIAAVRLNVVADRGRSHAILCEAHSAQRLGLQLSEPLRLPPTGAVQGAGGAFCHPLAVGRPGTLPAVRI
jgi:hypothetical protein